MSIIQLIIRKQFFNKTTIKIAYANRISLRGDGIWQKKKEFPK